MTGSELRAYRKKLNFTQKELADRLGLANNTVSRWEREQPAPENPKMLLWAMKGLIYELAGETRRVRRIREEVQALLAEMAESDSKPPRARRREKFGAAQ